MDANTCKCPERYDAWNDDTHRPRAGASNGAQLNRARTVGVVMGDGTATQALSISDDDAHAIWNDEGVYVNAQGVGYAYRWARSHGHYDYTFTHATQRMVDADKVRLRWSDNTAQPERDTRTRSLFGRSHDDWRIARAARVAIVGSFQMEGVGI